MHIEYVMCKKKRELVFILTAYGCDQSTFVRIPHHIQQIPRYAEQRRPIPRRFNSWRYISETL